MNEDVEDFRRERVLYRDGEDVFEGYVVVPQGERARPCVVLAHDWSGLTAPTERLAERYAALGTVCVALDVYGQGVRGDPVGWNGDLMAPLMADRAMLRRRLLAGYETAAALPGVDRARMAAVGYCFGGLCALDLARAGAQNLKAVVSFHGGLEASAGLESAAIAARILLLHGWADPIVPPEHVVAIAQELTAAGAPWELHAYGHAQHAFTFERAAFPERGVLYDWRADMRSWEAMRAHLREAFED